MARYIDLDGDIAMDDRRNKQRRQSPGRMAQTLAQQSRNRLDSAVKAGLNQTQQAVRLSQNGNRIDAAKANMDALLPGFEPDLGQKIDPRQNWNWKPVNAAAGIAFGTLGKLGHLYDTASQAGTDKLANEANPQWVERDAIYRDLISRAQAEMDTASPQREPDLGWRLHQAQLARDAVGQNTVVDDSRLSSQMMAEAARRKAEYLDGFTGWERIAADAAYTALENAPLLPLAKINPNLALAVSGLETAGQKTYDLSQKKAGAREALGRGAAAGAIDILTETVTPLEAIQGLTTGGKTPNAAFLRKMALEAGKEGENYALNYIVDVASGDPEATFTLQELAYAMGVGGLSGGMTDAGTGAWNKGKKLAARHQK